MKRGKSRKNNKNKILIIFLVIIAVILAILVYFKYTHKDKEEKVSIPKKKPEETVKIVDLNSDSRNIAVMINNISTVWGYQSGIEDAYIVYEMITEGGITRMMAIFRDQDTSRIASVRSSRHYFLDYVLENDALYVHIGGSDRALSDINGLNIPDITADVATWDNNIPLSREHRAYTSIEAIKKYAEKVGYKTTSQQDLLLNYSAKDINLISMEGAIIANNVTIPYSNSHTTSYTYDATNKVYKRFQNNKEHTDYVTKKQYTTKNIITYKVANSSYDTYGRQDLSNIGSGEGYFISEGYAVPIIWEKNSRSSQTVYKYKNGKEITVNDGNTFIQIEPSSQNITIN